MIDFSLDAYRELVVAFREAGYSFRSFLAVEQPEHQDRFIFLRHDVDFCLADALQLAILEHEEGITATYFIQLRSPFYNPLSQQAQRAIEHIHGLGHDIALHIDLNVYGDNYVQGLKQETRQLIDSFPFASTRIVSFHRPHKLEWLRSLHLPGAMHTYESAFFEKMGYISDSTGRWRYGHPLSSRAFESRESLQLVIHPIWWVRSGHTPMEKLENLLEKRRDEAVEFLRQAVSFDILI